MSSTAVAPNHYRCEACGGVFEQTWSDAEALAEKARDFPEVPLEACAVICDACYQRIME